MPLDERNYVRRRTHLPPRREAEGRQRWRHVEWRKLLVTVGAMIAVASAAVWLLRDVKPLIPNTTPAEGSLVVNINTATQPQLETVPGIGPGLAARIIVGRSYETVDDLLRVPGIGERSLQGMRPFLTTDGETRPR